MKSHTLTCIALIALSSAASGCATAAFHDLIAEDQLRGNPRVVQSIRSCHIRPDGRPEVVTSLNTGDDIVVSRDGMSPLTERHKDIRGDILLYQGELKSRLEADDTLEFRSPGGSAYWRVSGLLDLQPPEYVFAYQVDSQDETTATLTLCRASPGPHWLDLRPLLSERLVVEDREPYRFWWLVPFAPCYALTLGLDIALFPISLPALYDLSTKGR